MPENLAQNPELEFEQQAQAFVANYEHQMARMGSIQGPIGALSELCPVPASERSAIANARFVAKLLVENEVDIPEEWQPIVNQVMEQPDSPTDTKTEESSHGIKKEADLDMITSMPETPQRLQLVANKKVVEPPHIPEVAAMQLRPLPERDVPIAVQLALSSRETTPSLATEPTEIIPEPPQLLEQADSTVAESSGPTTAVAHTAKSESAAEYIPLDQPTLRLPVQAISSSEIPQTQPYYDQGMEEVRIDHVEHVADTVNETVSTFPALVHSIEDVHDTMPFAHETELDISEIQTIEVVTKKLVFSAIEQCVAEAEPEVVKIVAEAHEKLVGVAERLTYLYNSEPSSEPEIAAIEAVLPVLCAELLVAVGLEADDEKVKVLLEYYFPEMNFTIQSGVLLVVRLDKQGTREAVVADDLKSLFADFGDDRRIFFSMHAAKMALQPLAA